MDKWEDPYIDNKTTKLFAWKKTGIYLIRDKKTKEILYVGMSKSCLYKAMYRHFQKWDDYRFKRIVYHDRNRYQVRIILVNDGWVHYTEVRLIKYIMPRDNNNFYTDVPDAMALRPGTEVEIDSPF